jgi:cytidyltransferase-like protein
MGKKKKKKKDACGCGCGQGDREINRRGLAYAKHWAEDARLGTVDRQIFFTNGCFDGVHAGHLQLFKQIVRLCDFDRYPSIFVGVDSDARYYKVRGMYPRYSVWDRMKMIEGMVYTAILDEVGAECFYENSMPSGVPYVTPFVMNESPSKCMKILKPTDYAKGQDAAYEASEQYFKDMETAAKIRAKAWILPLYKDTDGKLSSSRQPRYQPFD